MFRIVTSSDLVEHLSADARRMLAAARRRLADYARTETPTGDVAALDAFAARLESRLAGLGATVQQQDGPAGVHLVARWGPPGGGPVLLLGHHDTVWPRGQLQAMPFVDEGAVIRGPGVFDMKGGLVVAETALELLSRRQLSPGRPVVLLVVADEEVGSPTARALVERYAADAVAVLGLEPPHPDGALKTARLGSTRLRVSVTGVEAHAALDPDTGVSAVEELVDQLLRVRRLMAEEPRVLCNVGTVSGGGRTNVVPGRAHADVGLRFPDAGTEQRVLDALHGLGPVRSGAEVTVEVLTSRPPWTGENAEDLLTTVQSAGAAVGQQVQGRPATGGADTNVAGALGVPTLDGFGPVGRGAHAPDEQIRADSLAERAALLASTLLHL